MSRMHSVQAAARCGGRAGHLWLRTSRDSPATVPFAERTSGSLRARSLHFRPSSLPSNVGAARHARPLAAAQIRWNAGSREGVHAALRGAGGPHGRGHASPLGDAASSAQARGPSRVLKVHASSAAMSGPGAEDEATPLLSERLLSFVKAQHLPIGLVAAILLGASFPAAGQVAADAGLTKLSTTGIFLISGLTLRGSEAKTALTDVKSIAFGLMSALVVTPLIGSLVLSLPVSPVEMKYGVATFACMPTSLSSCVTMTAACGGNSALAMLLVVLTNTLGIFSMPYIISNIMGSATGVALDPSPLLESLVRNILVPFGIGAAIRQTVAPAREWVTKNKPMVAYISAALLCLVPWMQVSKAAATQPDISASALFATACAGTLMHAAFLAFNTASAKALNLGGSGPEADKIKRAIILTCSQKTLPVAVTTITQLGAQMGFVAGLAVIPCVFSHFAQILIDSFVVSKWNNDDKTKDS
ncbi:unnamed protein product [Pedinophyceae sp. YPF-701]|nr:unnamed protein product [Pedinophyceae sp. YPF-701]